ncbi:hypothetical protein YPPY88_3527, partial [Yersinia pestis PY-88]
MVIPAAAAAATAA